MITRKDACDQAEISERTFRYWASQGLLPKPEKRLYPDWIVERLIAIKSISNLVLRDLPRLFDNPEDYILPDGQKREKIFELSSGQAKIIIFMNGDFLIKNGN